jgi:ethanolamine utilization protein EutN
MIVGQVVGAIHSTINHPFYDARKLLIVQKGLPGAPATGDYVIAVDTVDAGAGDLVLVVDEGNGARQVLGSSHGPVRSVIVGIIDEVTTE